MSTHRTMKIEKLENAQSVPGLTHSIVAKCLVPSLSKKEASSSRGTGFASTVLNLLNIPQDHASHWYASKHQNVEYPIIICNIFQGPVLKEMMFTKPIMLNPKSSQPSLWLLQTVKMLPTLAESSEILLQNNNGKSITTCDFVDSGSDVTMMDPSFIEQLEIQGEASQLFLSTV